MSKNWAKLFLTFIDLRKACDSVPRSALWVALGKLGVPEQTVQIFSPGYARQDQPGRHALCWYRRA